LKDTDKTATETPKLNDKEKTRKQLLDEIVNLRRQVTELEALENEHRQAKGTVQKLYPKETRLRQELETAINVEIEDTGHGISVDQKSICSRHITKSKVRMATIED